MKESTRTRKKAMRGLEAAYGRQGIIERMHQLLIQELRKWLEAGVMEEGTVQKTFAGTPQGGVDSEAVYAMTNGLRNVCIGWDCIRCKGPCATPRMPRHEDQLREIRTHGLKGGLGNGAG